MPFKGTLSYALFALISSFDLVAARQTWDLGNGFELDENNRLAISHNGETIWASLPNRQFLSASAGVDEFIENSGAFKINEVDEDKCQGQNITAISHQQECDSVTGEAVTVEGYLNGCGHSTAKYAVSFWVPAEYPNRVAFNVDVDSDYLTKVYLSFESDSSEDIYGLGAQASFASLKNQSVPIFSREQGVGRGDQPITEIKDAISFFSGGNHFTTYTSIPQFVSTAGRVFYLGQEDTAYANFDFTRADEITVRYDTLNVGGHFMKADNMLDGITMLTEYTGRMPQLPEWVDEGAILGIQGGQEKVNGIVERGLEADCPIAAVWLQDWYASSSSSLGSGSR